MPDPSIACSGPKPDLRRYPHPKQRCVQEATEQCYKCGDYFCEYHERIHRGPRCA